MAHNIGAQTKTWTHGVVEQQQYREQSVLTSAWQILWHWGFLGTLHVDKGQTEARRQK